MNAAARSRSPLPGAVLRLPLLLALLLACACAPMRAPVSPEEADGAWSAMVSASLREDAPFRDSLSLRFGEKGNTRRVTALLWGAPGGPLRLDVRAGVGVTVAMVSQDGEHFLLYAPTERKAWFHEGASPMFRMVVPLPFDLPRLAALLNGRWTDVFGSVRGEASPCPEGIAFGLEGTAGVGGTLVLDRAGRPVLWRNGDWRMDVGLDGEGLPERVELASSRGEIAVVLVKERETPPPFGEEETRLDLPEGTVLLPLSDFVRR